MWKLLLQGIVWIIGLFGGKSDQQAAVDTGVARGQADQKAADLTSVLKEVQDAKDAAIAAGKPAPGGVPDTSTDGFRRD